MTKGLPRASARAEVNWRLLTGSLVLGAAVGVVDYLVGLDYSVLPFYLIPVVCSAWFGGPVIGLLISIWCGAVWYAAQVFDKQNELTALIQTWNALMRVGVFSVVSLLAAQLHSVITSQRRSTLVDPLTGLENRRSFLDRGTSILTQCRQAGTSVAMAMVDIDHVRELNARHGHQRGDVVISLTARAVWQSSRRSDLVGRTGSDEFAVLMPATSEQQAISAIEAMRARMVEVGRLAECDVTMCVALVTAEKAPLLLEELLQYSEALLEHAQTGGPGTYKHSTFIETAKVS